MAKSHGGTLLLPVPHAYEQARLHDSAHPRKKMADSKIRRTKEKRRRSNRAYEETKEINTYDMKNFWIKRKQQKDKDEEIRAEIIKNMTNTIVRKKSGLIRRYKPKR